MNNLNEQDDDDLDEGGNEDIKQLYEDIKRNRAEAKRCKSWEELRDHIANTLWPYQEAKLEIVEEIDDAVGELAERAEDYLQPQTAALFATIVQASIEISGELRKRAANEPELLQRLDAHDALCATAIATLGEITVVPTAENGTPENSNA